MTQTNVQTNSATWVAVGHRHDLVAEGGIGACVMGQHVAIFWLPTQPESLYALSNYCPFSGAHLLARGIVGDLNGEPVVASPLYKQHFSLRSGRCLEDDSVQVSVWSVRLRDDVLEVSSQPLVSPEPGTRATNAQQDVAA